MPFGEQHILWGLERGEFIPYFQPLVDLRTGETRGFEILARWQHPERGLVPPQRFIPLIERLGLMNSLTASLLKQAFAEVRGLSPTFGLSVNLSPSQLHDRSLPALIHQLAEQTEFRLDRLTVELTESALVDDLSLAGAVAVVMKNLGIRLALDDFGTGYSSLLHLQALPFDELKVDSSFVRSMAETRQSRKITAAVVGLGASLGLQTVGEGIEKQCQANMLAWQGCTLGQGYLYGHPAPGADLHAMLEKRHRGVEMETDPQAPVGRSTLTLEASPAGRLPHLCAIYDGAPVGLAFLDCELRYVNLNQRLAQFNRREIQEHIGRKVSEIVPPEAYAQFGPSIERALAGEPASSVEIRKPPAFPGGPSLTLLAFYEPVRDEAGEIIGVSASLVDISQVKEKEAALRASEAHYRHTVEFNPQAPWVMDADGTNIRISSRWEALTGLTEEQTSREGWFHAVHPDDKDRITAQYRHSLETGDPMDLELRVRDRENAWVWVRSRGAALRDEEGKIVRWYGSVECIEDHKRALEELRGSEARLRAIFDAAPVGMVLVEAGSNRVLQANPRAEHLLGFHFSQDMVWDARPWQVFDATGERIETKNLPLARALQLGESTVAEEICVRRSDGSSVGLSATAAPVRSDAGEVIGGVLVVQEIDPARRESSALPELAGELTTMICTAARSHHQRAS